MKDLKRKGVALLTAAFTIVGVSGCSKDVPEDYPSEFGYISQKYNEFDEYVKTIIRNGEPVTICDGISIILAVNKDTFEVKEYIYERFSRNVQLYDLSTGYMVVDYGLHTLPFSNGIENWKKLSENNYMIDLAVEIGDYIEGEKLKDYYTLEEIRELEPKIVEALKKINEYKEKIKVK